MRRRVLVYANEVVGSRMAGPGIRSYHFARELSQRFDVTLAAPAQPDLDVPGVRVVVAPPRDARAAAASSESTTRSSRSGSRRTR